MLYPSKGLRESLQNHTMSQQKNPDTAQSGFVEDPKNMAETEQKFDLNEQDMTPAVTNETFKPIAESDEEVQSRQEEPKVIVTDVVTVQGSTKAAVHNDQHRGHSAKIDDDGKIRMDESKQEQLTEPKQDAHDTLVASEQKEAMETKPDSPDSIVAEKDSANNHLNLAAETPQQEPGLCSEAPLTSDAPSNQEDLSKNGGSTALTNGAVNEKSQEDKATAQNTQPAHRLKRDATVTVQAAWRGFTTRKRLFQRVGKKVLTVSQMLMYQYGKNGSLAAKKLQGFFRKKTTQQSTSLRDAKYKSIFSGYEEHEIRAASCIQRFWRGDDALQT